MAGHDESCVDCEKWVGRCKRGNKTVIANSEAPKCCFAPRKEVTVLAT